MANYLRYKYMKTPSDIKKHNDKLKNDVYNSLSDDEFYKLIKPRQGEINKFAKQRLREIEQRKYGIPTQTGCLISILRIIIIVILLVLL
jgi:hypothetical protein